jgi:ribosomal protein S18 acetylase RimI-like enzyme
MTSEAARFTTKELSPKTWPDFVKLFAQKCGWQHCWCVHFHCPHALPKSEWLPTRAQRALRNRRIKKALVEKDQAHGILVYVDGKPAGWCQYGRSEELPRIDTNRNYRACRHKQDELQLWRITCFVVDRKFRRRGVAGAALCAALDSIKKRGGGVVEAFPVSDWEGKSFGNMSTGGTVSMFKKEGFKQVGPFGTTNVVMRRTL